MFERRSWDVQSEDLSFALLHMSVVSHSLMTRTRGSMLRGAFSE